MYSIFKDFFSVFFLFIYFFILTSLKIYIILKAELKFIAGVFRLMYNSDQRSVPFQFLYEENEKETEMEIYI